MDVVWLWPDSVAPIKMSDGLTDLSYGPCPGRAASGAILPPSPAVATPHTPPGRYTQETHKYWNIRHTNHHNNKIWQYPNTAGKQNLIIQILYGVRCFLLTNG